MGKVRKKAIILGIILVLAGVISGAISIFNMSHNNPEWFWIVITSVASALAGMVILDDYI